jgi:hypothetical protein
MGEDNYTFEDLAAILPEHWKAKDPRKNKMPYVLFGEVNRV